MPDRFPGAAGSKPARWFFDDLLDKRRQLIGEVKNTAYVSYSAQLRDYVSYASANGYTFVLGVRENTRLSMQLWNEVTSGRIILNTRTDLP